LKSPDHTRNKDRNTMNYRRCVTLERLNRPDPRKQGSKPRHANVSVPESLLNRPIHENKDRNLVNTTRAAGYNAVESPDPRKQGSKRQHSVDLFG